MSTFRQRMKANARKRRLDREAELSLPQRSRKPYNRTGTVIHLPTPANLKGNH